MKIRFYKTPEIMSTTVDVLDIPLRAMNGLKRNGMFTLGNILERVSCTSDLTSLRSIGKESAVNIITAMADYCIGQMSDEEYEKYIIEMKEINSDGHIADKAV